MCGRVVIYLKGNRSIRQLSAAAICLLLALFCTLPASASSEENHGEPLTVGVPVDRCPILFLDPKTEEVSGIGADLLRYAAEEAGYAVTFRPIGKATLKEALDDPSYDLLLPFGSAIQSAAGQPSVVSDNLLQTPFTLVTESNEHMTPLNSLKVGMLRSQGGVSETVRQLYPGIEINLYEDMPACVDALRSDEVDALLHNSYVWSYVLQKPSYSDLMVQPSAMFSMDFRAGAPDTPKGRAVIGQLNKGIAALTDTRRQAVILDYTSRRLYQYDFFDYLHQYGAILILGVLLFAALAVIAVQRIRAVRRAHEKKMLWLLDHDPLTGVLSLQGFRKRVTQLLHENPDIPYVIAYANIKNFRFINDNLGRSAGDELLRFWADKCRAALSDREAVCRISADHFAVLRRMEGEGQIIRDDEIVIDSVRSYFTDRGKENRVQVCVGVYVLTKEDYLRADTDHMLDLARAAEKRVRDTLKDGYAFYNPEQWEKGRRAAEIVSHLPAAIRSGEIRVWYQPQVDCYTGKVIGAEALCRWKHAKLGWVSPGEFIPVLEEAGLIYELDLYVWDRVCRDLQRWNREGKRRSVSVNLSRFDIRANPDIAGFFRDLLRSYDLTPDQFRIEITETFYVENSAILISTTEQLRAFGFRVEMDDFGSGYSSLHMLKEVPVNRIKLDLHFLTASGDMEKSRTIVSYMVQMIRSLDIEILAEGVETAEQARFLRSRGCSEMQGYYFFKPMPEEEYDKLSEFTEPIAG